MGLPLPPQENPFAEVQPGRWFLPNGVDLEHFHRREALAELDGYDEVFIDTPPALNFYTMSALIAAQRCLIPFDCDDFSRRALYNLLDSVREVREESGMEVEELDYRGLIVFPRFDGSNDWVEVPSFRLGEEFTLRKVLGMIVVIAGVLLAQSRPRRGIRAHA